MPTRIDYDAKIPNNVELSDNRRLQRALEGWQPKFMHWWAEMGPALETQGVYLRTAVSVGREGWAHFDHVVPQDYRWASSWPSATRTAGSPSASTRASRPGSRFPASTGPTCNG